MSTPDDVIQAYVERLLSSGFEGRANVWQEQYAKVKDLDYQGFLEALKKPSFMALQGLYPPDPALEPLLQQAAERVSGARMVMKQVKGAVTKQVTFEYQTGFAFFTRMGFADEFLAFCREHAVAPDWVVARNFYYARNTVGLHRMASAAPATILEFGAGSGVLPIILWKLGIASRYIIVDLPEVLAYSATQVRKWLPDVSISFDPESDAQVRFVAPTDVDRLTGPVDISLNFISFAEMEKRWVDKYFDLVYRVSAPGALFYNANRTHQNLRQSDGTHFYNHSLLYPYRPDDDILMWDVDPLQDHSRSWVLVRPGNPAYARACRVKGTGARLLMPATAFHSHKLSDMLAAKPGWSPWSPA